MIPGGLPQVSVIHVRWHLQAARSSKSRGDGKVMESAILKKQEYYSICRIDEAGVAQSESHKMNHQRRHHKSGRERRQQVW